VMESVVAGVAQPGIGFTLEGGELPGFVCELSGEGILYGASPKQLASVTKDGVAQDACAEQQSSSHERNSTSPASTWKRRSRRCGGGSLPESQSSRHKH
jgi:hypothetical protein